jgi:probable rRNA maturation factor
MTDVADSITIQVDAPFAALVDEAWLARIVRAVLAVESQPSDAGVTVVITDDDQIQALNRDYREMDQPTDVLAFAAQEGEAFILPEGEPPYLGDVIVSYPTALAQATEAGQPVTAELALLVVHGCLHLLGYDHAEPDEQARMWARQGAILDSLA